MIRARQKVRDPHDAAKDRRHRRMVQNPAQRGGCSRAASPQR